VEEHLSGVLGYGSGKANAPFEEMTRNLASGGQYLVCVPDPELRISVSSSSAPEKGPTPQRANLLTLRPAKLPPMARRTIGSWQARRPRLLDAKLKETIVVDVEGTARWVGPLWWRMLD
jgi:hypothetical protein